MKKYIFLPFVLLLLGTYLHAQPIAQLAWATTGNPTVFDDDDFVQPNQQTNQVSDIVL